MGHQLHEAQAAQAAPSIACGVITISDTRTPATDSSGGTICSLLEDAGHQVLAYEIVPDDPRMIVATVTTFQARGCQVILTNGGTGIAKRDSTFEALDRLFEKRLPGFGELFRMLSYHEIGAAAMLSRATAGTIEDTLLFCLPGSTAAVRLGMERLILPQLHHLVWELLRQR